MYRYEYIALLDIDEVIMPKEEDNWSDLMKKVKTLAYKIKNEERASYNFRNVYFLDEMLEAHEKVSKKKIVKLKNEIKTIKANLNRKNTTIAASI